MNKKSVLFIFSICISISLMAQKPLVNFKQFNNASLNIALKYPEDWTVKNEDGVVSIEPKMGEGGIYISFHEQIDFPDEMMVNYILELNNLPPEFEENIVFGQKDGSRSWYISFTYADLDLVVMDAYKRKGNRFWFVSTETPSDLWKQGWDGIIIEILSSITIE